VNRHIVRETDEALQAPWVDSRHAALEACERIETVGPAQGVQYRDVELRERMQVHRRRLDARAAAEASGAIRRAAPFGTMARDTAAGRQRIAEAIARLDLGSGPVR
jgi:hypothetical protein